MSHFSQIKLDGSHQEGILHLIPLNQTKKCAKVFRKINLHVNGTPISRSNKHLIKFKNLPETISPLEKETDIPEQEPGNRQTHDVYIVVEGITGKIYTVQAV